MSNTFKIGDKITVNQVGLKVGQALAARDCTPSKVYTVTATGSDGLPYEAAATAFIDDVGDVVVLSGTVLTLAKEL
jgi:hypothetical protein